MCPMINIGPADIHLLKSSVNVELQISSSLIDLIFEPGLIGHGHAFSQQLSSLSMDLFSKAAKSEIYLGFNF